MLPYFIERSIMKLHEIIESDGFKRQIIDFDSEGRPVTKPYDGEEEPKAEEIKEETSKDTPTKTTEQTTDETPTEPTEVTEQPTESTETQTEGFKCQYCGRVIMSKVGLASHEKHCKENPANK